MNPNENTKEIAKQDSWQTRSEEKLSRVFEKLKKRRVELFVEKLRLSGTHIVLDLGSEDGSYLAKYYPYPENIVIADIHESPMKRGVEKFGLKGYRVLTPQGRLPFEDTEFDAVWCNSVIEHVTVPRTELAEISSSEFVKRAEEHQSEFAREIERVSKGYFVQTPNVHFPIESHSFLPLVAYMPHSAHYRTSQILKRFWVKQWTADFHLYNKQRFRRHFGGATEFLEEKALGLTKSFIAVRTT